MNNICTCGVKFRDAEDWRDHMPCPGNDSEKLVEANKEIKLLKKQISEESTLDEEVEQWNKDGRLADTETGLRRELPFERVSVIQTSCNHDWRTWWKRNMACYSVEKRQCRICDKIEKNYNHYGY